MTIALKETRETEYWLKMIIAGEIIKPNMLNSLLEENKELIKILTAIVKRSKMHENKI